MIALNADQAFLVYLGFTLLVLLGLWCYHHYKTRSHRLSLLPQRLQVCEYCHTAYLADVEKDVSRCPGCDSFNKT